MLVCLGPQHDTVMKGRKEGRQAGRMDGRKTGRSGFECVF